MKKLEILMKLLALTCRDSANLEIAIDNQLAILEEKGLAILEEKEQITKLVSKYLEKKEEEKNSHDGYFEIVDNS